MCCEHENTNVFSIYNTGGMVGESEEGQDKAGHNESNRVSC